MSTSVEPIIVNGSSSAGGQGAGVSGVVLVEQPDSSVVENFGPAPQIQQPANLDFSGAVTAQMLAGDAAQRAGGFVTQLAGLAAGLIAPTINPVFPTNVNAPAISAPIAPELVPVSYVPPQVPASFVGQPDPLAPFPVFEADAPALIFPNAPVQGQLDVPTAPAVDLNFDYPDVDVSLPAVPQLLSVANKSFNGVTFPTLSATAPVLTLAAPQVVAWLPPNSYTDALLSTLIERLQDTMDTGNTGFNTGLPASVEAKIWDRGREREYKQQADAIAQLERMETMGYGLPPGAYIDARIKIETETNAVMVGQSRDIAIKQADLEQANIKQALDTAATIEARLIDYANQREQRGFEAARYATEAGVSIYNAGVQAFAARVTAYRAAIDVYTAQMEGAKTQVAVFTAQIEAERLKVQVNTELVQQYKVQVDAALASLEVFKGQIQLIQARAQVEQLRVSIFGEQVRAYTAEANVYSVQVEAYKATISAEATKQQTYATQVQAYSSMVDATSKEVSASIEIFKAKLAGKQAEYQAYQAQVAGEAEKVRAVASVNESVAKLYTAEIAGTSAYNEAMVKEWQATIDQAEKVTQIGVSAAQANGQLYLSSRSIATDAAKVAAQVEAQIAASALGTVTYATHRSRQDSVGMSLSSSYGRSMSMSQSSSKSASSGVSSSTNVSASTSSQVSTANNTVHNIQSSE